MPRQDPDPTPPPEPEDPSVRLAEVNKDLFQRAARLAEMVEQPQEKRSETWAAEVSTARQEVMALDAQRTALQGMSAPEPASGQGPKGATRVIGTPSGETRSLGQQVVESEEYRSWTDNGRRIPNGNVEVRTLITGVQTDTGFTSAGAFAPIMPYVIFPQAVRRDRLVLRDLFATTTTTYEVVHYVDETYVSGSDADFTAEGAAKPEVTMNWARKDTLVQKIAAWVPATLESIADVPQLRAAIDNRLQYKLARREEQGLLNGSGTPPAIKGILNATGLQTQAFDTNAFVSFADGRAKIENVDGDATGAVWHPTDYWAAMAASSTTLLGASPFQGPPDTIWGLPAVRTPRMTAGHVLLGDFRTGAEIFDREDVTIRVGDQHSDYFIKNLVVILAEKRLTLAVYRGDKFVNVAVA